MEGRELRGESYAKRPKDIKRVKKREKVLKEGKRELKGEGKESELGRRQRDLKEKQESYGEN